MEVTEGEGRKVESSEGPPLLLQHPGGRGDGTSDKLVLNHCESVFTICKVLHPEHG